MIKLNDVTKIYKNKNEIKAIDGINATFPNNGLIFIVGKSGSGKTTLLNLISTFDKPDSGTIEIDNVDINKLSNKELSNYRNSCLGFVFQDFNLLNDLNVFDNIGLSLELQNKKNYKTDVFEVLKKVGLEGYENRKISELSGGQKQRVAIARAIIKYPKSYYAMSQQEH